MPPPTIEEIQHPLGVPLDDQYHEGVQSDPDYAPDDELENSVSYKMSTVRDYVPNHINCL